MDLVQLTLCVGLAVLVTALVCRGCRQRRAEGPPLSDSAFATLCRTTDRALGTLAEDNQRTRELLARCLDRALAINEMELARMKQELEARALELNLRDARSRFLKTDAPPPAAPPEPEGIRATQFADSPDEF